MDSYPTITVTLEPISAAIASNSSNTSETSIPASSSGADPYICQVRLEYASPVNARVPANILGVSTFRLSELGKLAEELDSHQSLETYGEELCHGLFDNLLADKENWSKYSEWYKNTVSPTQATRLVLAIDFRCETLQDLYWELLKNPLDGTNFATNEGKIFFSRLMFDEDGLPLLSKDPGDLRALVVLAGPDVSEQAIVIKVKGTHGEAKKSVKLNPLDMKKEFQRADSALGAIPKRWLISSGSSVPKVPANVPVLSPTLENIKRCLRDGDGEGNYYDILYIVSHGFRYAEQSFIFLRDPHGKTIGVSGNELIDFFRELNLVNKPRLVVLVACQGAGGVPGPVAGAGRSLTLLGPGLCNVGIPAVLAMQGDISQSSMDTFLPAFFKYVRQTGQIDESVEKARSEMRDKYKGTTPAQLPPLDDSWMPVLFMQLRTGRLWDEGYGARFLRSGKEPYDWDQFMPDLPRFVPVLSYDLGEGLTGSRKQLARYLATQGYPFKVTDSTSLPEVAQFLKIRQGSQDPTYVRNTIISYIRRNLNDKYGSQLDPSPDQDIDLGDLIKRVAPLYWKDTPTDVHTTLAKLPFSVYISAERTNLMEEALLAEGKNPQVIICPWGSDRNEWPTTVFDTNVNFKPDERNPFLYHFFGHIKDKSSLVLAKDEYFDALINMSINSCDSTKTNNQAHTFLKNVLQHDENLLVFLGFRTDSWDFWPLFRLIKGLLRHGSDERLGVAVQIDPEDISALNLTGALRYREYLQQYMGDRLSVYWGTAQAFVNYTYERWKASPPQGTGKQNG